MMTMTKTTMTMTKKTMTMMMMTKKDGDGDKTEEPEESAEAELGQLLHADVYTILTSPQIDFWRNGTHRFMYFSNLLQLSSTSRVDMSTFSSVLLPIVREKGMAK
jgi:hypothetical protein